MNASLGSLNKAIREFEAQIEVETRRMETHTQARRDVLYRRLEEAKLAVTTAEQAHKVVCDEKRTNLETTEDCRRKGTDSENRRNQAQARIEGCNTMITRCKERENNSLAPYGRNMKAVLEQIRRMTWHGETPIGPLGLHVRLKDQTWASLLRTQLGSMMSAFACTDARDRPQLKRIFEQSQK